MNMGSIYKIEETGAKEEEFFEEDEEKRVLYAGV